MHDCAYDPKGLFSVKIRSLWLYPSKYSTHMQPKMTIDTIKDKTNIVRTHPCQEADADFEKGGAILDTITIVQ